MIKIYTDSASDIYSTGAKELNIGILNIGVNFNDGPYICSNSEDAANFFKLMEKKDEIPTTSAVVPGDYLKAFKEAAESGDDLLYIGMSSGISSSMETANNIKNMLDYKDIYLVDSRQISTSQAALVEYACKLRDQGQSAEQIKTKIEKVRSKMKLFGAFAGLDHLKKGGRFSSGLLTLGSLMNIKPIVYINNEGKLELMAKVRGHVAAYRRLIKEFENDLLEDRVDFNFPISFSYTSDRDVCLDLSEQVEKLKEGLKLAPPAQMGPVIGSHVGPGLIALSYMTK